MTTLTPFLWFNDRAEEAAHFYISVFSDGEILETSRNKDNAVFSLQFQIMGQKFIALNGGPHFTFNPAISLFVSCNGQEEVDSYWNQLVDGGEEGQCGWLTDKFGMSWQIIPKQLGEYLGHQDRAGADRAMKAMLKMKKIEIR